MRKNQRVVKSIPDHRGNNYTKTSEDGKSRMQAAANYMDKRESLQLYRYENDLAIPTDRYETGADIENTETKYQQHMTFTTQLKSADNYVNEAEAIKHVAKAIKERRPDAEIYALALHDDGSNDENSIHIHAIFGTRTTLRRDDLKHFREEAYKLEKQIGLDNQLELDREDRSKQRKRGQER